MNKAFLFFILFVSSVTLIHAQAIIRGVDTAGNPKSILTDTAGRLITVPVATATGTIAPTPVTGVIIHETPITGVFTVPTPASTAVPVTFFVAPANSYLFEMTLVNGSVSQIGNVLSRVNTFGTISYPATIAPGILEDFNKNPWCFSSPTTFSVLESFGGGTISYSGFKH